MRRRYKGRHRKEPYGRTIGQITVDELKHREIWLAYDTEFSWWRYAYPQRAIIGEAL